MPVELLVVAAKYCPVTSDVKWAKFAELQPVKLRVTQVAPLSTEVIGHAYLPTAANFVPSPLEATPNHSWSVFCVPADQVRPESTDR